MRYYLRAQYRAALMIFRRGNAADYARAGEIEAHNKEIMRGIAVDLLSGKIGAAYIRSGKSLDVFTKSLRGDFIQVSHFCEIGGVMEALSHTDATTLERLVEEAKPGRYINILK